LFGVLKCKPVDSEAESPEFSHLGRDQVLHARNSRFRRLPDPDIARAKSSCCRTRISANASDINPSLEPKNRATFGARIDAHPNEGSGAQCVGFAEERTGYPTCGS
jgi:hypothetical protein